jgi:hypothetical protein
MDSSQMMSIISFIKSVVRFKQKIKVIGQFIMHPSCLLSLQDISHSKNERVQILECHRSR